MNRHHYEVTLRLSAPSDADIDTDEMDWLVRNALDTLDGWFQPNGIKVSRVSSAIVDTDQPDD